LINGRRVYLRALERADVERMHRWINDPETSMYLLFHLPFSLDQEISWYEGKQRSNDRELVLGIVDKGTDMHIGNVGLHNIDWVNSSAEIGIMIGEKEYWSKGLGADAMEAMLGYAFSDLNLYRVYLSVFSFNERAIRCYEKCGFVNEATLRDDVYKNNQYHDTIIMGILKDEFKHRGG